MEVLRGLWLDAVLTWQVCLQFIIKTQARYITLMLFVVILFVLQWLFNVEQLVDVVFGDNPLTVADRINYLYEGFINIFRYANDIVPISMIMVALFQAATLTLLTLRHAQKKVRAQQGLAMSLGILGVGCVACGGSLLTPILGLIVTNVSVTLAESTSRLLLILAVVLSYIALTKVATSVAKTLPKAK